MASGRPVGNTVEYDELEVETNRRGEGIAVVDPDRRVRYLDRTARRLLEGRLVLDETLPLLVLESETVTLGQDRGRPALELRPRPAGVDGGAGWLVVVADVSRRGTPEEQVAGLLAFAAHEMRTPITAVAGYAGTILEHGERLAPEVVTEFVTIIERQARRLGRMSAMLLTLARTPVAVEPEVVHTADAIAEVIALLGQTAEPTVIVGDHDASVVCDPTHLQEMLTNLISNAYKYGAPPVVVGATRAGEVVELRVTDHGRGVPEGFAHRMWDLFARARADERPAGVEGSGLGLGLVRSMAEANGGSVRHEPNEPHGSTFVVSLPRG